MVIGEESRVESKRKSSVASRGECKGKSSVARRGECQGKSSVARGGECESTSSVAGGGECNSESSVAGRVAEGSASGKTMAAIREPDVARRGQKSEESTHKPAEEKIWVSWQPSSSEEESEEEAGGEMNNGTVLVLPLEGTTRTGER